VNNEVIGLFRPTFGTIQFLINTDFYRNESDASASGQRKVASVNHGLQLNAAP